MPCANSKSRVDATRVDATPGLSVTNAFGYNVRSEVTEATMGGSTYSYAYDPIGNRMQSAVAVGSGQPSTTNTYAANALNQYSCITNSAFSASPRETIPAYDSDGNLLSNGWNVIRGTVAVGSGSTQSAVTNYYTWDFDLSGTLQGAGDVGGLLAVTCASSDTSYLSPLTYYPTYVANGNVTAYLDDTGVTAASFEYNAFGNATSDPVVAGMHLPHRFSTKYLDAETGLYYYGYRFYHPELGRWVSRDPIAERGRICSVLSGTGPY